MKNEKVLVISTIGKTEEVEKGEHLGGYRKTTVKCSLKSSQKTSMPNIHFAFENERTKDNGRKEVILLIHFGSKKERFHTGVEILPQEWDGQKSIVRRIHKNYSRLNMIIRQKITKLNDLMVKYTLENIPLKADKLRFDFENPEYTFDFIEFMESAINERKGLITDSTIRQHKGILSKLKGYKNSIESDQLTKEFFDSYNKYLKTTKKNDMNTRHGNIKTIRSYIQIAIGKGLLAIKDLGSNPVKQISGKRTFLGDQDFRKMIALYRKGTLSDSLQSVLRWFLFSCCTGLRISDVRRIKQDDIVGDLLILTPYKTKNVTGKTIKIPLMKFAKQLIEDEGENHVDGLVFNCIAEQNMREYIKMIAAKLKIKQTISWHTSRHTFATVFLRNTHDLGALQKVLGHANIRETMIYAHTMTEDVQSAMKFQDNY